MIGDRWGVTDDEVALSYGCDSFVQSASLSAWRGVSVAAPAATVWQWVGQVRLAPYSYDLIDNRGQKSPRELVGLAEPEVGEAFTSVGGRKAGRIVAVDPGRELTGTIMGAYMSYVVAPEEGGCRLLLKVVMAVSRWAAGALCVGDLVMARRQLLNWQGLAKAAP